MKAVANKMVWLVFITCVLLVLVAMFGVSRGVISADQERREAEVRADLEEFTRLALWRMDAVGSAIISTENGYLPSAYDEGSESFVSGDPLLRLHFELRGNGVVRSPEESVKPEDLAGLKERLGSYNSSSDEWSVIKTLLKKSEVTWGAIPQDSFVAEEVVQELKLSRKEAVRQDAVYQKNFNQIDKSKRARSVSKAVSNNVSKKLKRGQEVIEPKGVSKEVADLAEADMVGGSYEGKDQEVDDAVDRRKQNEAAFAELGLMRPVWIGEELFLLRQFSMMVSGKLEKRVQGVWVDQLVLKQRLLQEVTDLLPHASLELSSDPVNDPLALISFPLRLQQNESVSGIKGQMSQPLVIGWVAVLIALATVGALVFGIMRLSERRASFVSAVTHELRTPLTTFRLYSDMLESGAVKEAKRGKYLRVLTREADRLSHLVENVLSFSQIERGSARADVAEVSVKALIDRMQERFIERLASAGMSLHVDDVENLTVKVDMAAVEHILFNLIDNAAKYGADGDSKVVSLNVKKEGANACIYLHDDGKGISKKEQGRIFKAFHKSASEAAETKPGVGLGLALSRRLARSQKGDLRYDGSEAGACFILQLPIAK